LAEPFDLAVLDVGLPDMGGFDLCREIHTRGGAMKDAFFRQWLEYFQWNSEKPDTFPWQARETLSPLERMRIAKSIATFQLGENTGIARG
jgi:hypothetical protein